MSGRLRLAVLADYREERWPSMDLCADMLLAGLAGAGVAAAGLRPPYRRIGGTLWGGRLGHNAERVLNRHVVYPRFARRLARFDAFHVVDHSYAQLASAVPAGRVGVYCHDLDAFRCLIDSAGEPRPAWFRALARRTLAGLQRAAVVFHNTLAVRDELLRAELVAPERLVHAPLGVAPEFTAEGGAAPPWLAPLASPWLLHVGGTLPRKRIDVLLDVFAALRAADPALRLVKVGGEWSAEQRAQLHRLGLEAAVVHRRHLPRQELAQVYRRAALVLVPSSAEGFGLPVLEALACGAPVLCSDLAALREAGGPAAEYAPVADLAAWVATAQHLLAGRGQVTRAARLAWAARHRWDAHAAIIAASYRRVLGG